MSHTKTATAEHIKAADRELAKARSPSPPPHPDSRAASLAPPSPRSIAARLASPQPDLSSRLSPVPERKPAAAPSSRATPAPADSQSDPGDEEVDEDKIIDLDTFNQILDLDEEDTHEFSLGMAEAYFAQASTTFTDMDNAFDGKDLAKLSSLGHFLKGSSAALGVCAVQATCEHIQHYGALRDEESGTDLTEQDALAKIGPLLKRVKREYAVAERWLKTWYKEHEV
ncbi:histidine-phosphotransfer domain HPT domain-containing protein [Lenzites betulinus]|nr:histidine-phosphotransfer domain HPT domain-containing protein [Lenzites betulinus]